jgi:hypothetical protein
MINDNRLPIKENYLLYLEEVPKHKFACKAVKISEDTGKRWRNEDQDFADLCEAKISEWVRKTLKRTRPEFQLERLLRDDFAPSSSLKVEEKSPLPVPIMGGPLADPVIYQKCLEFLENEKNK